MRLKVYKSTIKSIVTKLIYLTDSYLKQLKAKVISCVKHGANWEIILDQTIFYPRGGGQPSDQGEIIGSHGKAHIKQIRIQNDEVTHECSLDGKINTGDSVNCLIDWAFRYQNMRLHSAGHVVHEAIMQLAAYLIPLKGEHGNNAYIEYKGSLTIDKGRQIEQLANQIVGENRKLTTEFVTLEELQKRASYVPEHLSKHKPLRILQIDGFAPIPDGGTQVKGTSEIGPISLGKIENEADKVRVYYAITKEQQEEHEHSQISSQNLIGLLLEEQQRALVEIKQNNQPIDILRNKLLGNKSELGRITEQIRLVTKGDRHQVGEVVKQVKTSIEEALSRMPSTKQQALSTENWIDVTAPGAKPPLGHLHIVSQAISEITRIFERIGFTRVRHPEIDWDWYAFESLNMPPDHPARDEWETFFIESEKSKIKDQRFNKIVLTPHTSNGQVREMERGKLPIRIINIAKCYRRQIDVSHTPMFHQFEGLYVDKNVSIGHLKGVLDYFVKQFFGPKRQARIRPFHFRFTEPSFEVDISCGVCEGRGCKLCKEGWLELGGAGMIHPVVLKNGGVDPDKYTGFAFGWGVERTAMMKSGTKLDDIRILYNNDVRFLEQF